MRVFEIAVDKLHPHPANYREHPQDQLDHIARSLKDHGMYRNVVIARDDTILAGHGVVQAARSIGMEKVRAVRLDLDPNEPRALKLLAGDNEIGRLAEVDDRKLTELLRGLADSDDLQGTGFDAMMLANLVYVTRPESEISDLNEAGEWTGMPTYEPRETELRYTVLFRTAEDRDAFVERTGLRRGEEGKLNWSSWDPTREKNDIRNVRVVVVDE